MRWLFYPQAIVLDEGKHGWKGLVKSWHVTRGRWIKTLGATIGFLILALVPGPLAGVLILILGGSRVQFANLTSSFLYGLLLPLAYIGLTMVYRRLKGETIVEPQMITQELHPEKARKLPGIDLGTVPGGIGRAESSRLPKGNDRSNPPFRAIVPWHRISLHCVPEPLRNAVDQRIGNAHQARARAERARSTGIGRPSPFATVRQWFT